MAAEFVVPFRQGGKNDGNDALAIAIAARQPTMRFVPVKAVEQQAILVWQRMRQGWVEERTALLNRMRGLLVNGARSALQAAGRAAPEKATRLQFWMVALAERCGDPKARVAIANTHARMIWAMLARDEADDPQAWRRHPRTATAATAATMPTAATLGAAQAHRAREPITLTSLHPADRVSMPQRGRTERKTNPANPLGAPPPSAADHGVRGAPDERAVEASGALPCVSSLGPRPHTGRHKAGSCGAVCRVGG